MTTVVATLDPKLAKRVARAADNLKMTHTELATEAIRLFVRSCDPIPPRKRRAKTR